MYPSPATPVVDAHQQFWALRRDDYFWLQPGTPLYRDFQPVDLAPLLAAAGVQHTVLVQTTNSVSETRYLLEMANDTEFVAGVVGWVDMLSSTVYQQLGVLDRHPKFLGVRPMLSEIRDPEWMLDPALDGAFRELISRRLCVDAMLTPRHLPTLLTLLRRYPELRVVVDHAARPRIRERDLGGWRQDISAIARETGAYCKLSGLPNEAGENWRFEDLEPYMDHLLGCFGSERLMWGSDWPTLDLHGGYQRWWEATWRFLERLGLRGQEAILGGTAVRFYGLALG